MTGIDDNYDPDLALLPIDHDANLDHANTYLTTMTNPLYNLVYSSLRVVTTTNGGKILFEFDNDGNISADLVRGEIVESIKSEDLPSELKQISNLEQFNKYLDNSFAKISQTADGGIKIDLHQKLNGGGHDELTKFVAPQNGWQKFVAPQNDSPEIFVLPRNGWNGSNTMSINTLVGRDEITEKSTITIVPHYRSDEKTDIVVGIKDSQLVEGGYRETHVGCSINMDVPVNDSGTVRVNGGIGVDLHDRKVWTNDGSHEKSAREKNIGWHVGFTWLF